MAQRIETILLDDLSGEPAAESVSFALDNVNYSIDLSEENAFHLRAALEPFITAGRKTTAGVKVQGPRTDKAVTRAIREWAEANNWAIKSRGRIPHEVVEAYHAAA
jgi:hypothetical protein